MASSTTSPALPPVYFWRQREPEGGCFSQWYHCAFFDPEDPSVVYPTAEHYMMYQKALLFNDTAIAPRILSARHPRDVKALGRQVKNFNEAIWRRERERIVLKGNILKFTNPVARDEGSGWFVKVTETVSGEEGEKNEEGTRTVTTSYTLREMLLRTGDREIVEASPMDRIWGIGFAAGKAEEVGRERWGLNLLGKALMEVRRLLREEEKKKKKDEAGKGEGEESEA